MGSTNLYPQDQFSVAQFLKIRNAQYNNMGLNKSTHSLFRVLCALSPDRTPGMSSGFLLLVVFLSIYNYVSTARTRSQKNSFLNCKWVILLHMPSALENNL
jgi:hypothetical protein